LIGEAAMGCFGLLVCQRKRSGAVGKKITSKEVRRRERNLTAKLDAKNLADLEQRRPDVVECIQGLLDIGHDPHRIGYVVRRDNPQMWVESKFAESVARALIAG
jgi:hypothetical protein